MLNSHITPFPLHYVSVNDSKNATCPRISRNKLNCSRPEMGVLSVAVFLSRRRDGWVIGGRRALSPRQTDTGPRRAANSGAFVCAQRDAPRRSWRTRSCSPAPDSFRDAGGAEQAEMGNFCGTGRWRLRCSVLEERPG